jgi:hypothetical protein
MVIQVFLQMVSLFLIGRYFDYRNGQEISFIGKDTSKNGKYYVIRTYFTHYNELSDLNGMICFLDGLFDSKNKSLLVADID